MEICNNIWKTGKWPEDWKGSTFIPIFKKGDARSCDKGPSIYDVHTEGGGGQAQVDACGRGEGGPAPCGRPHRKLKLESTDVILSSSHAKKLASFLPEFHLWTENKWKFFCDIN